MNRTGKLRLIVLTMAFVSSGCEEDGPTSLDRLQPAEATSLETIPYEQIGGGMIAFQRADDIYIVDLDARTASVIRTPWLVSGAAIAPDRSRIAYSHHVDYDTGWDLFTVLPDGTGVTRVSSFRNQELWPTWTPDGNAVVANTGEGDGNSVHLFAVRPAAPPAPLWYIPDSLFPAPVGRFSRSADSTLISTDESHKLIFRYAKYIVDTLYTAPESNIYAPTFSPDGSRIAFLELAAGAEWTRLRVKSGEEEDVRTVANLGGDGYNWASHSLLNVDLSLCWLDDDRIVFVKPHMTSMEEVYSSLYMVRADGTGLVRITTREVMTDSVSCAR